MLGIYLLLCVLALLVIGLLACIAWDACGYDERIIALEAALKEQAEEIRDLHDRLDESFAESYLAAVKPEAPAMSGVPGSSRGPDFAAEEDRMWHTTGRDLILHGGGDLDEDQGHGGAG